MRRFLVFIVFVWMAVFALGAQERPPVTTAISTPPQTGAYCGNGLYYVTLDSELRVYRASTNQIAATMPIVRPTGMFQISYDGSQIYTADLFNGFLTVMRFDWTRGTLVPLAKSENLTAFSVSPNGRYLTLAENEARVRLRVIDLSTGLLYKQWNLSSTFRIEKIAWLSDSTRFVTPGPNIWNIDGARLVARTPGSAGNYFAISPNGEYVATRVEAERLAMYRTADGTAVWGRAVTTGRDFGFSSDNAAIVLPAGHTVQFLSVTNGLPLPLTLQTTEAASSIATSPTTQDFLWFAWNELKKYRFFSGSGGGYGTASIERLSPTYQRLKPVWIQRGERRVPALAGISVESGLFVCQDEVKARYAPTPNLEPAANPFDLDETGKLIAVAQNMDGVYGLNVLNAVTGARIASQSSRVPIDDVQFARNGRILANSDVNAVVYDFSPTGGLTALRTISHIAGRPMLTADGNYVLVRQLGTLYSVVRLIRVSDGVVVGEWDISGGSYERYYDHWTSEDGTFGIATQTNVDEAFNFDYQVQLYHVQDGRVVTDRLFALPGFRYSHIQSRTSPDGRYLAISRSFDQDRFNVVRQPERLLIYRRDDGTLVRDINGSYLANGREFAWGKDSRTLHLLRRDATNVVTTPVVWERDTIYCQPGLVVGGANSIATIVLQNPAPAGGLNLTLSDDSPFASLPAAVTVAEGRTSVQVPVATLPVDFDQVVTITARTSSSSFQGVLGIRTTNTLDLVLNANPVPRSATVGGSVRINGMAGPAGVRVSLESTDLRVHVPESVLVPPGATTASFTIQTESYIGPGVDTITGRTPDALAQFTYRLRRDEVQLLPRPEGFVGGTPATISLSVLERYSAGSVRYALASDNPNVLVPSSVTLAADVNSMLVNLRSRPVNTIQRATISLRSPTGFTTSCVVYVLPPSVDRIEARSATVKGGGSVQVVVYLTGPAPAGFSVGASSNSEFAVVPATVAFAENAKYAVLTVTTKPTAENRIVTISVGGQSTEITITP